MQVHRVLGLTAIIILTGAIEGVFAYKWAFDEAIEIQDSVLIQLASLAQSGSFPVASRRVEEDTEVRLIELGTRPHGSPDNRQLSGLQDSLQDAMSKGQPVRVLLRTRSDGSRFAWRQRLPPTPSAASTSRR
jgi:two-component system OmpR family sensor kinase